jgi:hypothetical protein
MLIVLFSYIGQPVSSALSAQLLACQDDMVVSTWYVRNKKEQEWYLSVLEREREPCYWIFLAVDSAWKKLVCCCGTNMLSMDVCACSTTLRRYFARNCCIAAFHSSSLPRWAVLVRRHYERSTSLSCYSVIATSTYTKDLLPVPGLSMGAT